MRAAVVAAEAGSRQRPPRNAEEGALHEGAENVPDRDVGFLYVLHVAAGYADDHLAQVGQLAPAFSGQDNGAQLALLRARHRSDHVQRPPTGADADQHIARTPQGFHLAGEHSREAEVVGVRGQERGVRRQRDGRQWRAHEVPTKDAHELGRDVLAVGGAAPVATQEDLAAGPQGSRHQLGGPGDLAWTGLRRTLLHLRTGQQVGADSLPSVKRVHSREPAGRCAGDGSAAGDSGP